VNEGFEEIIFSFNIKYEGKAMAKKSLAIGLTIVAT